MLLIYILIAVSLLLNVHSALRISELEASHKKAQKEISSYKETLALLMSLGVLKPIEVKRSD